MTNGLADPTRPWTSRLFKLEAGEGAMVLRFALLGAMIQAGVAMGLSGGDALFLSHLGIERLPVVYLLTPLVMFVYVPVWTRFLRLWGIQGTVRFTLILLVAGGAGLFFAIRSVSGVDGSLLFYGIKLYTVLWEIALFTLFWNFTDTFFDIQDGKRLFALFSGGSATGAIAGGLSVAPLTNLGGIPLLFLVWGLIAAATLPVVRDIRRRYVPLEESEDEPGGQLPAQKGATAGAMFASPYVLLFTTVMVMSMVLLSLVEYQSLGIFAVGRSQDELAGLFGRLFALVNVFNLAINLLVFSRLVLAVGVNNVALIQPVAFFSAFLFMLLRGDMAAAVFGFFTIHGIIESIEYNNQNFLFNAVPAAVKQRFRTIAEGIGEPLATAIGGFFLLLLASRISPIRLSTMGLLGSALLLLLVFFLGPKYLSSLVSNMKRSWLDLSVPVGESLANLGAEELEALPAYVKAGDRNVAQAALRILWMNDPVQALRETTDYLDRASEEDRESALDLVTMILNRGDAATGQKLLDWALPQVDSLDPEMLLELARHGLLPVSSIERWFESDDPTERAIAIVAAWRSSDPAHRLEATQELADLLNEGNSEIAAALRSIGLLRDSALTPFVTRFLRDPDLAIRRSAIGALRGVSGTVGMAVLPPLLDAIKEGTERDQWMGLSVLGDIGDPECIRPILHLSPRFSPMTRRAMGRVLVQIGHKGVPNIVAVLRDSRQPFEGRILAARSLAQIAFPQFETLSPQLLRDEVLRGRHYRECFAVLRAEWLTGPGGRILTRYYQDTVELTGNFIVELLSLSGRIPNFEMITAALRSGVPKKRANALETIEQGVGRRLFRELRPLLGAAAAENGDPTYEAPTVDETVMAAVESPFSVECSAAALFLLDRGTPDDLELVRAKLASGAHPLLHDTVLTHLEGRREDGMILTMDQLAEVKFFRNLSVWDRADIAAGCERISFSPGQPLLRAGDPASHCYLILRGRLREGSQLRGPGEIVGIECLAAATECQVGVDVLEVGEGLKVRADLISDLGNRSPRVAEELLRFRHSSKERRKLA